MLLNVLKKNSHKFIKSFNDRMVLLEYVERLEKAENAKLKELKETLKRFAEKGIHSDCNPTMSKIPPDEETRDLIMWFYSYLKRADTTVRNIAREVLEKTK